MALRSSGSGGTSASTTTSRSTRPFARTTASSPCSSSTTTTSRRTSPSRLQFLSESLGELESELARRDPGSSSARARGRGARLARRETGADAVYSHLDHEPHGAELSREAESALSAQGTKLRLLPDLHLVLPGALRTEAGKPFRSTPRSRAAGVRRISAPRARAGWRPDALRRPRSPLSVDPEAAAARLSRRRGACEPAGWRARGAATLERVFALARSTATPMRGTSPGGQHVPPLSAPSLRDGRHPTPPRRRAGRLEGGRCSRPQVDRRLRRRAGVAGFFASILAAFPAVLTESFRPEFERFRG